MSNETRVELYIGIFIKLIFVGIGIWFWTWYAGKDLDKATYVVIALLVMLSAELDLKFESLQRSIAELKGPKSATDATDDEGEKEIIAG